MTRQSLKSYRRGLREEDEAVLFHGAEAGPVTVLSVGKLGNLDKRYRFPLAERLRESNKG